MSSDILVPAGGSQSTVSVGVMLSNERVKRGISLQEVADQLKLSRKQIEALENDDFDRLPGVAFVRGFTRNYAKFLGLDPTPLMLALDVVLPARTPPIISSVESAPAADKELSTPTSKKKSSALMIGVAALSVAGLFGVYSIVNREPSSSHTLAATSDTKQASVVPAASVTPTAPKVVAPVAVLTEPTPVPAAPTPTVDVKPEAIPKKVEAVVAPVQVLPATSPVALASSDQAPTPAKVVSAIGLEGGSEIRLKVTQNSWLSVIDGGGKKLLYGEIVPGEERTLSGQPPFKLTIGNASGVSLSYKGQPVDLGPSTKGATARLVLK